MQPIVNSYDLSKRLISAAWSGSVKQCCRQLDLSLAASASAPGLALPSLPLWSAAEGWQDGRQLFQGKVVYRKRDGEDTSVALRCMDYGLYLTNNEGWYSFDCTPEQATRQICSDFGLEAGELASTGVTIRRKFAGKKLHQILYDMYTKASEQTGKKYVIRVDGKRVSVVAKPETGSVILAPRVNIRSSSIAEDGTNCCNTVAIYSESGEMLRTLGGWDEVQGLLQRAVIQKDGEDAGAEAQALLDDGVEQQTVTVEVNGDPSLISGGAVVVRETTAGVSGLFWIDSDTHTWKNGDYVTRLSLNFRNLMNEVSIGAEV